MSVISEWATISLIRLCHFATLIMEHPCFLRIQNNVTFGLAITGDSATNSQTAAYVVLKPFLNLVIFKSTKLGEER